MSSAFGSDAGATPPGRSLIVKGQLELEAPELVILAVHQLEQASEFFGHFPALAVSRTCTMNWSFQGS